MISKMSIDTQELVQIFILSNTPYYLFKNYQSHPSIELLSEQYSTDELIELFEMEKSNEKNTYEEVVIVYAILIALTKKPYMEVEQFFLKLGNGTFKWAKQISNIYFAKQKPESIVTVELGYKSDLLKINYTAKDSTNYLKYEKKPIVIVGG